MLQYIHYVTEKDKKLVMEDLKPVYKAVNEEIGYENLLSFEEKWGKKYPLAAKSWMDNWTNLSTFFEYEDQVRKIIYPTNPIEGMHRQIRKVIKSKGAFSSCLVLKKLYRWSNTVLTLPYSPVKKSIANGM